MEKVEVNAIATTRSGLFTQWTNSFFDKGDVRVTAVFPDKTTQSLGQADIASFPKFSTDARSRSFALTLNRLPDKAVTGLIFEGTVPLSVAKRTTKAAQAFDPERPGPIKLGGVDIKQFKVDGKSVQFQGNDTLLRIKTLSFKLSSGQVVQAERGAWARMNNEHQQRGISTQPLPAANCRPSCTKTWRPCANPCVLSSAAPGNAACVVSALTEGIQQS